MNSYIVLLRGVNVGGNSKLAMAELKAALEEMGCHDVATYINSGNVLLKSDLDRATLGPKIESILTQKLGLNSANKVLVLTAAQLQAVIDNKPKGFGEQPDTYHSDAIFLMDVEADEAMKVFDPREGVDKVWPGKGVIYSQRLSAQRTKSRLGKIVGTPAYKLMTIRSWNTTTKLLELSKSKAS